MVNQNDLKVILDSQKTLWTIGFEFQNLMELISFDTGTQDAGIRQINITRFKIDIDFCCVTADKPFQIAIKKSIPDSKNSDCENADQIKVCRIPQYAEQTISNDQEYC